MQLEEIQKRWKGIRFQRDFLDDMKGWHDAGVIDNIAVLRDYLCVQARKDVDDGFAFILVKMPLENDKLEDVCDKMNAKLIDMSYGAVTVYYGKQAVTVTFQNVPVFSSHNTDVLRHTLTYLDTPAAAEPAGGNAFNADFLTCVDNAWSALMDLDTDNYAAAHGVALDIAAAQLDKINGERNNIPVLTVVMTAIVATMSERHVETFEEWMLSVGDNNLRAAWRWYNVTEYMPDLLKMVRAHELAAPEVPLPLEDYYEIVKTFVRRHGWT